MSVYIDDMKARYGRMVMCHMIADTSTELFLMADLIGVDRKHIQAQDTHREHFDICLVMRTKAVAHGAIEVTQRDLVRRIRDRDGEFVTEMDDAWDCPSPAMAEQRRARD